jgi:hypothetical protein
VNKTSVRIIRAISHKYIDQSDLPLILLFLELQPNWNHGPKASRKISFIVVFFSPSFSLPLTLQLLSSSPSVLFFSSSSVSSLLYSFPILYVLFQLLFLSFFSFSSYSAPLPLHQIRGRAPQTGDPSAVRLPWQYNECPH